MRAKRVLIPVLLLFTLPGIASARDILQGDQCVVEADETIDGNLFVLCRSLTIDGQIEGNLIGAALDAEINGVIVGDVYLAAGQLDARGALGKDLHFVGPVLSIHPETQFTDDGGDVMSASLSTAVLEGARVPGTIVDLGYQLVIEGSVEDEVSFWGSALTIDGRVNGDVDATVGDPATSVSQLDSVLRELFGVGVANPGLLVTERSVINGQLSYTGPAEGRIEGTLASEPEFTRIHVLPDLMQQDAPRVVSTYVSDVVREFLTLIIVGGIGLALMPRSLQAPIRHLQMRPVPSLSLGLITFILSFPLVFIAVLLSVMVVIVFLLLQLGGLVIIVGVVLGLVNILAASIFYFVAIYVARVIVALAVGQTLIRMGIGENLYPRVVYLHLLAGVMLLAILYSLPLIGWFLSAVSAFLGLGAMLLVIRGQLRVIRDTPASRIRLLPRLREAPPMPPPMIGDSARPPGMENLPEGFQWWEDDD
jgi:cytoskeletal protein CcmA (bactofilin family)